MRGGATLRRPGPKSALAGSESSRDIMPTTNSGPLVVVVVFMVGTLQSSRSGQRLAETFLRPSPPSKVPGPTFQPEDFLSLLDNRYLKYTVHQRWIVLEPAVTKRFIMQTTTEKIDPGLSQDG
ncbi:hypothetical protein VTO42DRAFT_705 [Malbranchea cinnamomea]